MATDAKIGWPTTSTPMLIGTSMGSMSLVHSSLKQFCHAKQLVVNRFKTSSKKLI